MWITSYNVLMRLPERRIPTYAIYRVQYRKMTSSVIKWRHGVGFLPKFQKWFPLLIYNFCPNMKSFPCILQKLWRFWDFEILIKKRGISSFTVPDVSRYKIRLRQDELMKLVMKIKNRLIMTQIFISYPDGSAKISYKVFKKVRWWTPPLKCSYPWFSLSA